MDKLRSLQGKWDGEFRPPFFPPTLCINLKTERNIWTPASWSLALFRINCLSWFLLSLFLAILLQPETKEEHIPTWWGALLSCRRGQWHCVVLRLAYNMGQ